MAGLHTLYNTVCSVAKSCMTLCNPMDCSPPHSSVDAIFQARILERVAISFSRESSWRRDWTISSALAGGFFTTDPLGKPKFYSILNTIEKLKLRVTFYHVLEFQLILNNWHISSHSLAGDKYCTICIKTPFPNESVCGIAISV